MKPAFSGLQIIEHGERRIRWLIIGRRWPRRKRVRIFQLAAAGVPLRQVQEWLGHSTINMTMRYAHLAPGSGASLILALEPSAVATTWQREGA